VHEDIEVGKVTSLRSLQKAKLFDKEVTKFIVEGKVTLDSMWQL